MKIKLIDADSLYREVHKEYECTEVNARDVLKKISMEYRICSDEDFNDLVNDLFECRYAECEEYGGDTWILEMVA